MDRGGAKGEGRMISKRIEKVLERYRVATGKGFRLKDVDPASVTQGSMSVSGLTGTVAYDVASRTVTFVSSSPFGGSTGSHRRSRVSNAWSSRSLPFLSRSCSRISGAAPPAL